jgi:hypothetical protein
VHDFASVFADVDAVGVHMMAV